MCKVLFFFLMCPLRAFSAEQDSLQSLVKFENHGELVLEEGVSDEIYSEKGRNFLKIQTEAAPTKGPSVYIVTVKVDPGKQYTYFVKGYKRSACRILHYVVTPRGNLVWPGADVEEGISRTVFTTPDDVSQVTLALSFLNPQEQGHVLIEDIALFPGNVATWPEGESRNNIPSRHPPALWPVWLFLILIMVLIAILFFAKKDNLNIKKTAQQHKEGDGLL